MNPVEVLIDFMYTMYTMWPMMLITGFGVTLIIFAAILVLPVFFTAYFLVYYRIKYTIQDRRKANGS